ncbi:hypothetical protein D9M69_410880 [compost metagenome]
MSEWSELKRLAEESKSKGEWYDAKSIDVFPEFHVDQDFMLACTPDAILALIAENERLRAGARGDFDLDAWLDWSKEAESLRAEVGTLRERAEYWRQRAKSAEGHLFTSDWRAARHALHMHTALASTPWDALTDSQQAQISSAAGAVIAEVNARREVRMPHDAAMSKGGRQDG